MYDIPAYICVNNIKRKTAISGTESHSAREGITPAEGSHCGLKATFII
jgi:hypothetical protein